MDPESILRRLHFDPNDAQSVAEMAFLIEQLSPQHLASSSCQPGAACSNPCADLIIDPPQDWHDGNTHLHVQGCTDTTCDPTPPDDLPFVPKRPMANIQSLMNYHGMEFGAVLLWAIGDGDGPLDEFEFKTYFSENAGFDYTDCPTNPPTPEYQFGFGLGEHPQTANAPGTEEIHMGLEVSQFSVSAWGHLIALGIDQNGGNIYRMGSGEQNYNGPLDYSDCGVDICNYPPATGCRDKLYDWAIAENDVLSGLTLPPPAADEYLNDGTGRFMKVQQDRIRNHNPSSVLGWAHLLWPYGGWSDPIEDPLGLYADVCLGGWDWANPEDPFGLNAANPQGVGYDAKVTSPMDGMAFPEILTVGDPAQIPLSGSGSFTPPQTANIQRPVFAPIDVAWNRVDFLEAARMSAGLLGPYLPRVCKGGFPDIVDVWYGLYYKLLSAGQRVSISGGSDYPCGAQIDREPHTYVYDPDGGGMTYAEWLTQLKKGRSAVTLGGYLSLDLDVFEVGVALPPINASGVKPGETLFVESGDVVLARAAFDSKMPVPADIELLFNGVVVDSAPLTPGTFDLFHTVTESGWLVVRTGYSPVAGSFEDSNTHTSAVYVIVDDRPIADAQAAEYFTIYCDFIEHRILNLQEKALLSNGPEILEYWVGRSGDMTEMLDYLDDGRAVYAAIRDYALIRDGKFSDYAQPAFTAPNDRVTLVDGTNPKYRTRVNPPGPPTGISVATDPVVGQALPFSCFNMTQGWQARLYIGTGVAANPTTVGSAPLYVTQPLAGFPTLVPGAANGGELLTYDGFVPSTAGQVLYAQFLIRRPGGSWVHSSEVLKLVVQP